MERLTKKEQELYFQINRKLLGEDVTIDLSGYTDFKEVSEDQEQNKPEKLKRTKFTSDKTEVDAEVDTDHDDNELRFRPIVESTICSRAK